MIEENTVSDIRQPFIKNINEELQRLTVEELDKVYKFIRTNIIANIKE
jgi:1,2-phenylacetyl-CoA epoxidase catalytic subunit